jgi:hypothetical protein
MLRNWYGMIVRHRLTLIVAGCLLVLGVTLFGGSFMSRPRSAAGGSVQARDSFAQDRVAEPGAVPFDGDRAMTYLKDLCKIGTRISGTDGMQKQQEMLKKHFEERGGKVSLQPFTSRQQSEGKTVEMANLIVNWHPDRKQRVLLCSHYDTRPHADEEEDPRRKSQPFISANDGGSGVVLLMELANHMKDLKTKVGVDFVLFDGEEYVFERRDEYFFGSKHFAKEYKRDRSGLEYRAAILLDMIGGRNPHFPVEQHSAFGAGPLVRDLWAIARDLKCTAFDYVEGPSVLDDHLALLEAKIPAVDIIDFDYPHWHRLSDLPANCSGDSLKQVARVLTTWLQRVEVKQK